MTDELSVPKLTKLAETIGFEITEFTPGSCVVELTIREDHLNAGGVAHGGLHATLLDTAMGGTLVTTLSKKNGVQQHNWICHILNLLMSVLILLQLAK